MRTTCIMKIKMNKLYLQTLAPFNCGLHIFNIDLVFPVIYAFCILEMPRKQNLCFWDLC